uniref:HTH CENPB-type domain-containing protein n=1 Tax=Seriola lalandi dorsalis TaxID=1841481 RepID=A0A3B4WW21_SERLL
MPRKYTRKATWGKTPLEEMESAASDQGRKEVHQSSCKGEKYGQSSLLRFIKKKEKGEVKSVAWGAVAEAKRILTDEMEEELAKHLKQLAEQFHGLPPVKCCQLAFEYAEKNNIPVPANWTKAQSAGEDWFGRFLVRRHLSVVRTEATSLGRATAFNKTTKIVVSSSEESDVPIPLDNVSDEESSGDERNDPGNTDLSVGDFAIVNFATKHRSVRYIGMVEKVEDDEILAQFLRRIQGNTKEWERPTFAIGK